MMMKRNHPSTTALDSRAKRRHDKLMDAVLALTEDRRIQNKKVEDLTRAVYSLCEEMDRKESQLDRIAQYAIDTKTELERVLNAIWLIDYKAEESVMTRAAVGSAVEYKGEKWWMASPERDWDGAVLIARVENGVIGEKDSFEAAFTPAGKIRMGWRRFFGGKSRRHVVTRVDPKELKPRVK